MKRGERRRGRIGGGKSKVRKGWREKERGIAGSWGEGERQRKGGGVKGWREVV